jgi:hypothetical protein
LSEWKSPSKWLKPLLWKRTIINALLSGVTMVAMHEEVSWTARLSPMCSQQCSGFRNWVCLSRLATSISSDSQTSCVISCCLWASRNDRLLLERPRGAFPVKNSTRPQETRRTGPGERQGICGEICHEGASKRRGFAILLFGLRARDKAKDNPGLAASYKSMPCRERPGVNSSKSLATSSSCLR